MPRDSKTKAGFTNPPPPSSNYTHSSIQVEAWCQMRSFCSNFTSLSKSLRLFWEMTDCLQTVFVLVYEGEEQHTCQTAYTHTHTHTHTVKLIWNDEDLNKSFSYYSYHLNNRKRNCVMLHQKELMKRQLYPLCQLLDEGISVPYLLLSHIAIWWLMSAQVINPCYIEYLWNR